MGKWKNPISTTIHNGADCVGKRFGHWVVLGFVSNTGAPRYRQIWKFQCDCGRVQELDKGNIVAGKSGGCSDCTGQRHVGSNNPNWRGQGDISGEIMSRVFWNAKARNIDLQVTSADLQQAWNSGGGRCALSGMLIELGSTASLDRIDSELPYTPENIQWVHKTVNHMKNNYAESVFIDICCRVADHIKGR